MFLYKCGFRFKAQNVCFELFSGAGKRSLKSSWRTCRISTLRLFPLFMSRFMVIRMLNHEFCHFNHFSHLIFLNSPHWIPPLVNLPTRRQLDVDIYSIAYKFASAICSHRNIINSDRLFERPPTFTIGTTLSVWLIVIYRADNSPKNNMHVFMNVFRINCT